MNELILLWKCWSPWQEPCGLDKTKEQVSVSGDSLAMRRKLRPHTLQRLFRFQTLFPSRNWSSHFSGLSGLSGCCIRRSTGRFSKWLAGVESFITNDYFWAGDLQEGMAVVQEPRSFQRGCTEEVLIQHALISSCKPADSASASVVNVFQTLRLKILKVHSWTLKV